MFDRSLLEAGMVFMLSFLSEDAAMLSAALLVAGGSLPLAAGASALFFGIWLGDLGLYALARCCGDAFAKRFVSTAALERSRAWFARRGALLLIVCRFVPGLRLPTYVTAGLMRFPVRLFGILTGVVAAIWITAVFTLSHWIGLEKFPWIREHGSWVIGLVATLVLGWPLLRRVRFNRFRALAARWKQWEFWPAWLFYSPVALIYLFLSIRHRGFTLPAAANPGIPMGGLVGESKFDTLRRLREVCPEHTVPTWLIEPGEEREQALLAILKREEIPFPIVLKPDVGQRGAGVKIIRSLQSAREYLAAVPSPVLIQRYAPGPKEAGVFYYRFPHETSGHILAITEKIFPAVAGDGRRTVEELILADPRAAAIARTYLRRFESIRNTILPVGETLKLVESGNHAQGCIFRDGSHLATPQLLAVLDEISRKLGGFYIGRFDIRYGSDSDLQAGRNLAIVELNGAGAEATSIYDARNSLFSAYRMLFRQWNLIFTIGAMNRSRGEAAVSLRTLWLEWRRTTRLMSLYPLAD